MDLKNSRSMFFFPLGQHASPFYHLVVFHPDVWSWIVSNAINLVDQVWPDFFFLKKFVSDIISLYSSSFWIGDAFWPIVDTVPRMPRLTSPRRAVHKVCSLFSTTSHYSSNFDIISNMTSLLVTSRDCPIFYRRKKAQKDMAEARSQLDRWSF